MVSGGGGVGVLGMHCNPCQGSQQAKAVEVTVEGSSLCLDRRGARVTGGKGRAGALLIMSQQALMSASQAEVCGGCLLQRGPADKCCS